MGGRTAEVLVALDVGAERAQAGAPEARIVEINAECRGELIRLAHAGVGQQGVEPIEKPLRHRVAGGKQPQAEQRAEGIGEVVEPLGVDEEMPPGPGRRPDGVGSTASSKTVRQAAAMESSSSEADNSRVARVANSACSKAKSGMIPNVSNVRPCSDSSNNASSSAGLAAACAPCSTIAVQMVLAVSARVIGEVAGPKLGDACRKVRFCSTVTKL